MVNMKAVYYIYRNLRTGGFSIKWKGKVIRRCDSFYANNVSFKVSQKGRNRVIKEHQKNVHAYAVADVFYLDLEAPIFLEKFSHIDIKNLSEIKYNPYKNETFMCNDKPILFADNVKFYNGKCYTYSKVF